MSYKVDALNVYFTDFSNQFLTCMHKGVVTNLDISALSEYTINLKHTIVIGDPKFSNEEACVYKIFIDILEIAHEVMYGLYKNTLPHPGQLEKLILMDKKVDEMFEGMLTIKRTL